jgi:hypothetical protein
MSPMQIRIAPNDATELDLTCRGMRIEAKFPSANESPFTAHQFSSEQPGRLLLRGLRGDLVEKAKFPFELLLTPASGGSKLPVGRIAGVILIGSKTEEGGKVVEISKVGGEWVVKPDHIKVNRPDDERVEWRCEQANFIVHFDKDGSPFEEEFFLGQRGRPNRSGAWKTGDLDAAYDYTVRIFETGQPPVVVDPTVDVDDSGGTGG